MPTRPNTPCRHQIPEVGSNPDDSYKAEAWDVTPSTYNPITEDTIFTYTYVKKDTAVLTTAPEAADLTYNGEAQELVTTGTSENGTIVYALGEDAASAPEESLYTEAIPTAVDAGTYYVWYKVKAAEGYDDSEPVCIEVSIAQAESSAGVPTAKSLIYNGEEQELLTPPSKVVGGQIVYALGSTEGEYSTDIPKGKDAGEYTVSYRLDSFTKTGNITTSRSEAMRPTRGKPTIVPGVTE